MFLLYVEHTSTLEDVVPLKAKPYNWMAWEWGWIWRGRLKGNNFLFWTAFSNAVKNWILFDNILNVGQFCSSDFSIGEFYISMEKKMHLVRYLAHNWLHLNRFNFISDFTAIIFYLQSIWMGMPLSFYKCVANDATAYCTNVVCETLKLRVDNQFSTIAFHPYLLHIQH